MNAQAVGRFSHYFNPLLGMALLVFAIWKLRGASPFWIFKVALAVGISQQISKIVQHTRVLGDNFPSTHFAVALALATGIWLLNRRLWPPLAALLAGYCVLILVRHYHAPLDLLGALYVVPLTIFTARIGTRRKTKRQTPVSEYAPVSRPD